MSLKIIILSPNAHTLLSEEQLRILQSLGDVTTISEVKPLGDITELYEDDGPKILAIDPDFCDWSLPNEVIDRVQNLQAICLQTTSFSWVDVEYAKQKGVPVLNLRGFSSVAVGEWATMQALALARRLPVVIEDSWKPDLEKHRGTELRGKVAGIIGMGRIGTVIAENLAGLGMKVQYWSRSSEDERYEKVSLEELVGTSDVIASAVAHTDSTETLLSDELVRTMKPTACLVDITHPIYNKELVLSMVAEGKLGGFAFEDEKNPFGHYEANVWNGPALAWATYESMSKNASMWVESIVGAAKGEYLTRVN